MDNRRTPGHLGTIEELQIIQGQWKTYRASMDNTGYTSLLWTIGDFRVCYGQQKTCMSYIRPVGFLFATEDPQVFQSLQKSRRSSIRHERPEGLLFSLETYRNTIQYNCRALFQNYIHASIPDTKGDIYIKFQYFRSILLPNTFRTIKLHIFKTNTLGTNIGSISKLPSILKHKYHQ